MRWLRAIILPPQRTRETKMHLHRHGLKQRQLLNSHLQVLLQDPQQADRQLVEGSLRRFQGQGSGI